MFPGLTFKVLELNSEKNNELQGELELNIPGV